MTQRLCRWCVLAFWPPAWPPHLSLIVWERSLFGWRVSVCHPLVFAYRVAKHWHELQLPRVRPWPQRSYNVCWDKWETVIFLGPVEAVREGSMSDAR